MATEMAAPAPVGADGGKPMVVIDIGKRKRKQVRDLKKGSGRLVQRIEEAVAQMKANGTLDSSAQTVVVVVEKKRRQVGWL